MWLETLCVNDGSVSGCGGCPGPLFFVSEPKNPCREEEDLFRHDGPWKDQWRWPASGCAHRACLPLRAQSLRAQTRQLESKEIYLPLRLRERAQRRFLRAYAPPSGLRLNHLVKKGRYREMLIRGNLFSTGG